MRIRTLSPAFIMQNQTLTHLHQEPFQSPTYIQYDGTARPRRLKALFMVFLHRFEIDLMGTDYVVPCLQQREVNLFIEEDTQTHVDMMGIGLG
jgi:hypothetical protein